MKRVVADDTVGLECLCIVGVHRPRSARIVHPVVGRESHKGLDKTIDDSSILKLLLVAYELVNVSVDTNRERSHILHLRKFGQAGRSEFVDHEIILTLNEQMCVTTHIVIWMTCFVVEHAS